MICPYCHEDFPKERIKYHTSAVHSIDIVEWKTEDDPTACRMIMDQKGTRCGKPFSAEHLKADHGITEKTVKETGQRVMAAKVGQYYAVQTAPGVKQIMFEDELEP
jgi:hypothetical protein